MTDQEKVLTEVKGNAIDRIINAGYPNGTGNLNTNAVRIGISLGLATGAPILDFTDSDHMDIRQRKAIGFDGTTYCICLDGDMDQPYTLTGLGLHVTTSSYNLAVAAARIHHLIRWYNTRNLEVK